MRILLSCLQGLTRHPLSHYEHWRLYFIKGCEEAGVEFVEVPGVDWAEGLVYPAGGELKEWRARTWEAVLDFVHQEHTRRPIHLFLGYLYPQQIEIAAIDEFQRMGIPCVNFFCDNVREFHKVPAEFYCFDLHWVPEYQAIGMYRKAGLKHIYAAMPCWVSPERRTCNHSETEGTTFIGSPDDLRHQMLGQAIQLGADINIYGIGWNDKLTPAKVAKKTSSQFLNNQWQDITQRGLGSWLLKFERRFRPLPQPPAIPAERLRGNLSPGDFERVMQQSKVALGINRVATHYRSLHNPITYSRLRDIEAPMLGACYLTEWAEDLGHLYDLGVEVETYKTPEELKGKLDTLLKNPGKRRSMRRRAQARALNEHTVARTLSRICERIEV